MASKTLRARNFELQVATYLKSLGWQILYHDVRIRGVQVDLLARDQEGILTLTEVKAQNASGLAHLTWRQKTRLFRVAGFLSEWEPVALQLALVHQHRVQLLPVDGLTAG